jgi:hypothetical protein
MNKEFTYYGRSYSNSVKSRRNFIYFFAGAYLLNELFVSVYIFKNGFPGKCKIILLTKTIFSLSVIRGMGILYSCIYQRLKGFMVLVVFV